MKKQQPLLLITIATLLISNNFFGQICFGTLTNFTSGLNPYGIVTAEFNGDSNADIVVCNNSANSISVMLGTGTGSFGVAVNYALSSSPAAICTGDFNMDSYLDLGIAGGTNNLWVMLGTGTGTFNSPISLSSGGAYPGGICSGDFNGDGKKDLVVANGNTSNSISLFLGNGNGTFSNATSFNVGTCPCGFALTSADFNNDGRSDIAVANQNSNNVSILLGTLSGGFTSQTFFNAGSGPWDLLAYDFNFDNNKDIAVVNRTSNNVSILTGDGQGAFSVPVNYSVGSYPLSISLSDFNNDGINDLITANRNSNNLSILLGNSLGTFGAANNISAGTGLMKVVTSDFNNDSKNDIAVTDHFQSSVSVFLNTAPKISVNSGTICLGNSFTISPTGASNYAYSAGLPIVTPSITSTYTVIGTTGNCSETKTVSVTVNPLPTITAVSSSTLLCVGQTATVTSAGANTYTWSNGDTGSTIVVTPTATTNYTVTGTNAANCSNTSVVSVSVSPCTGVEAFTLYSLEISVFPNPVKSQLHIDTEVKINSIQLLNSVGQLVLIKEATTTIDVSQLSNGIYFIKLYDENNQLLKVAKFVKE